jgi:hypothetical protein
MINLNRVAADAKSPFAGDPVCPDIGGACIVAGMVRGGEFGHL